MVDCWLNLEYKICLFLLVTYVASLQAYFAWGKVMLGKVPSW